MNFAAPAFLILIFLLPGLLFANRILVNDGNSNTDRPFSLGLVLAIICAPILHLILISLIDLLESLRDVDVSGILSLFTGSIAKSETIDLTYPEAWEITAYLIVISLMAFCLGALVSLLRHKGLFFAINNDWPGLYKFLRYDSENYNMFYGFISKKPLKYFPVVEGGPDKTVIRRDVKLTFLAKKRDEYVRYSGNFVNYTLDNSGVLNTISIGIAQELGKQSIELSFSKPVSIVGKRGDGDKNSSISDAIAKVKEELISKYLDEKRSRLNEISAREVEKIDFVKSETMIFKPNSNLETPAIKLPDQIRVFDFKQIQELSIEIIDYAKESEKKTQEED